MRYEATALSRLPLSPVRQGTQCHEYSSYDASTRSAIARSAFRVASTPLHVSHHCTPPSCVLFFFPPLRRNLSVPRATEKILHVRSFVHHPSGMIHSRRTRFAHPFRGCVHNDRNFRPLSDIHIYTDMCTSVYAQMFTAREAEIQKLYIIMGGPPPPPPGVVF
jgi:hypothetical protein